MNGGFPSLPKSSSQTFMQQALIAELLQQADNGSLSSSSILRPPYTRNTPHTVVVEEMSEERPHSATSMREAEEGQHEENDEIGASCHGEDSDSDNDEVGAVPVRRPGKPGRKYPTRTELNRAAQFRYRQRQKARIHELEAAFQNCKLYELRNISLRNEVQRLRIENNAYQAREAKIMTLLEAVDVLRHAMPNLNLEQQQSMMQDIAACVNNVRNGIDKQTLASERWQKLLPRILADDWNLTDLEIKNLLIASGKTGAAVPIRPSDLKLQMTLYTAETHIVSVLDVMKWTWRDYHKVYHDYTAEAARLYALHKQGDPGAGLRMAQLLQELRGMFIVFTVVDMRHQRILLMSNMENLSVVPDSASSMVAQKCAADLAATLTAQQKARVVDLHKQYVERQGVIKSRRAELVPHAQRTLDTDRSLTPAEQVQALEAQGLLQANLDEELENMSLLSYVFTSVILSAFQCAVMCASAYPYGANLPAILEALHDILCAPPNESTAADVPGPVAMLQEAPTPGAPAPASEAAQPTQAISVTTVLQASMPHFDMGASLGDPNFAAMQLLSGNQQQHMTHSSLYQGNPLPLGQMSAYVQGTTASPVRESEGKCAPASMYIPQELE